MKMDCAMQKHALLALVINTSLECLVENDNFCCNKKYVKRSKGNCY